MKPIEPIYISLLFYGLLPLPVFATEVLVCTRHETRPRAPLALVPART